MKVVLKPVSHPEIGEIDIGTGLFAIGRNEEPFTRLGDAARRLSRRHARIFQEDEQVFITDLGSLNGTRVNERLLKEATSLHDNDLVSFGEELAFRVEIKPEHATAALPSCNGLLLVPTDSTSGMEEIAIEHFPFLVSRAAGMFEQYAERFPEALRKLSRRHAVFAMKGGDLYVEDLASANGTFVDGERLDERARRLVDGDTVMFGAPQFSYTVCITPRSPATRSVEQRISIAEPAVSGSPREGRTISRSSAQSAPMSTAAAANAVAPEPAFALPEPSARASVISAPAQVAAVSPPEAAAAIESPIAEAPLQTCNRTRFVSSADSFINVFCADDERAAAAKSGAVSGETVKVEALERPRSRLRRVSVAVGNLWRAVNGPTRVNRRVAGSLAMVAVMLVAAAATIYVRGADRRDIKALLEEGKYVESAAIANAYLARRADDREAARWAEEAMTKAVVPPWMAYIQKGSFKDAARYLQQQMVALRSIPNSRELIDTLAWAGRVREHMAARGASGRIVLFEHEALIKELVSEWDADSFRRQQIMDQILTRIPAFEPIHGRVFSDLRTLRSDEAVYVKAMEQLDADVMAAVKRNDRAEVERLIGDFESEFAQIGGVDALRQDLKRYDQIARLVQEKQLLELVRVSRATKFRTPSFARYGDEWLAGLLPPQPVIDTHAEASRAWHDGKYEEAIAILEPLAHDPAAGDWSDVAARQIDRYRKVESDYRDLLVSRDSDAYGQKLLLLWSSLHPAEDVHVMRALQPDFVKYREQVLPRLTQSMQRGQSYWNEYQNAGGIPGVVRVEGRVSERFSGQAKRLSNAYAEVTSGVRTYQLLQTPMPPEWQSLQEQVVNEVQRQRRWLEDLNIVLEPALLNAKLALLPQVSEQSLWAQSTTAQDQD